MRSPAVTQTMSALYLRQPNAPANRNVVVGVGDIGVLRGPGTLVTHALGSCVAVSVHDPAGPLGVLLHVLLPESGIDVERARREPAVFADTGVITLIRTFLKAGGSPGRAVVRMAGGGHVVKGMSMHVGKRNVLAVRRALWGSRVRIASEDVGGTVSRTVALDVGPGTFRIRVPGQPEFTR